MASLDELIELLWEAHDDGPWTPKQSVINDAKFREWMSSDDIEVLGFLFSMTGDPRIKIEPQLTTREYLDFVKHCSERCFMDNPDGEWSDSRYSAGWNVIGIFCWLWDNNAAPSMLAELKDWLAGLYLQGNPDLRLCLETATLEHLFERKDIRRFFSDWKGDPVLKAAFDNASLWVKGGGKSPLSRSRKE
jgi:hypothetical protein